MYQYKKKGTSTWIDCSKANYEAYKRQPLSLNYLTRQLEPLEGLELAEVKPKKKTTKKANE